MPKERIDDVYQSNWRYVMTEYYRGCKNENKSETFSGMKSGIYRGVKWYATTTTNQNKKRKRRASKTTTK